MATGMLPLCLDEATKVIAEIESRRQVLRVHRAARRAHRHRRCRRAGGRDSSRYRALDAAAHRTRRWPAFRGVQSAGAAHVLGAQARRPAAVRAGAPGHRSGARGAHHRDPAPGTDGRSATTRSTWSASAPRAPTSACWARTSPAALGTCGHLTRLRRTWVEPFRDMPMVTPRRRARWAQRMPAGC